MTLLFLDSQHDDGQQHDVRAAGHVSGWVCRAHHRRQRVLREWSDHTKLNAFVLMCHDRKQCTCKQLNVFNQPRDHVSNGGVCDASIVALLTLPLDAVACIADVVALTSVLDADEVLRASDCIG
jgi:hypothetical protein